MVGVQSAGTENPEHLGKIIETQVAPGCQELRMILIEMQRVLYWQIAEFYSSTEVITKLISTRDVSNKWSWYIGRFSPKRIVIRRRQHTHATLLVPFGILNASVQYAFIMYSARESLNRPMVIDHKIPPMVLLFHTT